MGAILRHGAGRGHGRTAIGAVRRASVTLGGMKPQLLGFAVAAIALTVLALGPDVRAQNTKPCQWVPASDTATPGATYEATASIRPGANARFAKLVLEFGDADNTPITDASDFHTLDSTRKDWILRVDWTAPAGTAYARAALSVTGSGECDTTLTSGPAIRQTKAPPPVTPAPAPEPSETPTETVTPTPTPSPTPTPTPTPEATRFVPGQLLANGGFERLEGDAPAGWRHSGLIGVTNQAYGGRWALTLSSGARGAKWADRAAPVEGGQWYAASAWADRKSVV